MHAAARLAFLLLIAIATAAGTNHQARASDPAPSTDPAVTELPDDLMVICISSDLLQAAVGAPRQATSPVQDTILGYPVTGTAASKATCVVQSLPDSQRAVIRFQFHGTIASQTSSVNGPVDVRMESRTDFTAVKLVTLDATGLHVAPAQSRTRTQSWNTAIHTSLPGLRGRIAQRIAERRTANDRDEINAESDLHAQAGLNKEIDARVDRGLTVVQQQVAAAIAGLPHDADMPTLFECRSGERCITIVARRAAREPSEAVAEVALAEDSLARIRVHSSLVRRVMFDPRLRTAINPVTSLIKPQGSTHSPGTQPTFRLASTAAPQWQLAWTDDGQWFEITCRPGTGSQPASAAEAPREASVASPLLGSIASDRADAN